ncbi:taurine hydroxylase-like protein SAT17 [Phialemonium atrogriseum]|uniref:Taurine hydroxylase-like protein SAT17 n=1 Tax=Phialemonium atrogriseum TaxID=1093897 RepID=A0AAJ0C418_9PEZI|nr:taurine hydroxylase-like protein SAT17 [Phialemonium atrogriseum]KAK1769555.1 taurine hydroxylase-like protein SAT17 [Phialemonium atrogriseum]
MALLGSGPVISAAIAPCIPGSNVIKPAHAQIPALPSYFPTRLDAELAWTHADFPNESSYIYELTGTDLEEINKGLIDFKALGMDGDLVNPENFPLPLLGPKLDWLSREVHHGKGFCVVRGVDPGLYSVEDLTLVYLGIQSYIADQRGRQDRRGNMLVHIIADNSTKERVEHHRHSTKSITFHNEESGDIVSWLTRSTAASGGKCIIASCYAIYNILAARRPDIIRTLARSDWPFALPRFQCRPIIFLQDSRLIMNFGRAALLGSAVHPRPPHLPPLTARQMEALAAIETIAQATQMEIQTRAGDMHFVNNLAVLHRREAFVDGEALTEKRHLVRMRLRSSQYGWEIPEALRRGWHDAFDKEAERVWHLEPMPDAYFPLRKYPN